MPEHKQEPAGTETGKLQPVLDDNAMKIVMNELDKAEQAIAIARSDLNGRQAALRDVSTRIDHLRQEVAQEERAAVNAAAEKDEIRVRAAVEAADELRRELGSLREERDRYQTVVRKLTDYLDELQTGVGSIRGQISGLVLNQIKQQQS